jgi:hypothetical protein
MSKIKGIKPFKLFVNFWFKTKLEVVITLKLFGIFSTLFGNFNVFFRQIKYIPIVMPNK